MIAFCHKKISKFHNGEEFLEVFKKEAAKKEKHALVSLNWSQAVFSVSFEEKIPEIKKKIPNITALK